MTTLNHLSDDWGWYIDIEHVYSDNNINVHKQKKTITYRSALKTINEYDEDEYYYYINNQKDLDSVNHSEIKKNKHTFYNIFKNIFNIMVIIIASTLLIVLSHM